MYKSKFFAAVQTCWLIIGSSLLLFCLAIGTPTFGQKHSEASKIVDGLLPAYVIKNGPSMGMNLYARMKYYGTPGISIALIENFKIKWCEGFGTTLGTTEDSVTSQTLFQAGSISKAVTAVGAFRLIEQGKLYLDEDVNKKLVSWKVPLNEFTLKEKPTVKRILAHAAGFNNSGFESYAVGDSIPTLLQILDGQRPANTPPVRVVYVPGSKDEYSGGGYLVLQQLMMDVSNKSFPKLMQDLLFSPLKMTSSTFEQPLPKLLQTKAARGNQSGAPVKGGWTIKPEMAAGGLWTTPADLAKLAIEVQLSLNGKSSRLLNQATTNKMLTLQPNLDSFSSVAKRALGFEMNIEDNTVRFGHGGYTTGYRSEMVLFPNGQGAIVMSNGSSLSILKEVLRGLAVAYHWPSYKPTVKTIITLDSATLKSYVGEYKFPEGRRPPISKVTYENSNLYFDGRLLKAEANNKFFGPGEDTYTFIQAEDGKIKAMIFEVGTLKLSTEKIK